MSLTLGDAPYTTPLTPVDHQHPEYQPTTEKGQAGGYAALDAGTKVPIGQLPTGATGATVAAGNHNHDANYAPVGHTHPYAPASHQHVKADVTDFAHTHPYQPTTEKGQANGYAGLDAAGKVPAAQLPAQGSVPTTVRLTADAASPTQANTLGNVTGLSFAVAAGQVYRFKFLAAYSVPATTTGSRWTISAPAGTLAYRSEYSLTATSRTVNDGLTAGDLPAAANASSAATAGNIAVVEGIVVPSVNGTVQLRVASEVANSVVTAKAGSWCEWLQM